MSRLLMEDTLAMLGTGAFLARVVSVQDPDSADLRAFLRRGGAALSETWTYQLFAH